MNLCLRNLRKRMPHYPSKKKVSLIQRTQTFGAKEIVNVLLFYCIYMVNLHFFTYLKALHLYLDPYIFINGPNSTLAACKFYRNFTPEQRYYLWSILSIMFNGEKLAPSACQMRHLALLILAAI